MHPALWQESGLVSNCQSESRTSALPNNRLLNWWFLFCILRLHLIMTGYHVNFWKLWIGVYPSDKAWIAAKLCQNAFCSIPDMSFFDVENIFSKVRTAISPPRMAPFGLKLRENTFQMILDIACFNQDWPWTVFGVRRTLFGIRCFVQMFFVLCSVAGMGCSYGTGCFVWCFVGPRFVDLDLYSILL